MSGRCGENTTKNKPCRIRVCPYQKCVYHEQVDEDYERREKENTIEVQRRMREAEEMLRAIDRTDSPVEKQKLRKLRLLNLQQLMIMSSANYLYDKEKQEKIESAFQRS
jgi:hypothetical protein